MNTIRTHTQTPACIAAKMVSFLDVMVRAIRVDLLWRQAQDGKATKGKPVMLKSLSTALILRGIGAVALGIMAFGISLFACAAMGAVTLVTHRNAA